MDQRLCCCGAYGWTRVIAWLQIISSALLIIGMSCLVYWFSATLEDIDEAKADRTPLNTVFPIDKVMDAFTQALRVFALASMVGSSILLIFSILALSMAIVLLRGSLNKNPRLIHAWIVFASIFLAFWVVVYIVEYFSATFAIQQAWALFGLILGLIIQGFSLLVVTSHWKEIEASATLVLPANI